VRVIETNLKVLGEEHLDTLLSMVNLASTFSNRGQGAGCASDGDEKEGAWLGASRRAEQHE